MSDKRVPGCTCGRHRKYPPGCICGRHPTWESKLDKPVKYHARHVRVYVERGRAREHQCVNCDQPAQEWAQIHDTDGMHPYDHYQPMCFKCHKAYDDIPAQVSAFHTGRKQSPETLAKRGAALRGKPRPPGLMEALAEHNRGTKRSVESREKMRQSALARHKKEREARDASIE